MLKMRLKCVKYIKKSLKLTRDQVGLIFSNTRIVFVIHLGQVTTKVIKTSLKGAFSQNQGRRMFGLLRNIDPRTEY